MFTIPYRPTTPTEKAELRREIASKRWPPIVYLPPGYAEGAAPQGSLGFAGHPQMEE